jgi:hypothetical protein
MAVEGACVYLYATDGTSPAGYGSCTNGAGVVEISPVAGTYRIAVADPLGRFVTTWYGGTTGTSASDVSIQSFVDLGSLTVVGFGDLSGTVTDDGGTPVSGVVVYLNNAEDGSYSGRYGVTDANGVYVIDQLPEGHYVAGFYPEGMVSPTSIWYSGASDEASATWIRVPSGGAATGIDAVVPAAAGFQANDPPDSTEVTSVEDLGITDVPSSTEAAGVPIATVDDVAGPTTSAPDVATTSSSSAPPDSPPPSDPPDVSPPSEPVAVSTEPTVEN